MESIAARRALESEQRRSQAALSANYHKDIDKI
jgi:hypothetical protein